MLQLPILVFQMLQLLRFSAVHPPVLRLPAIVGLLRYPVLPAQFCRCQPGFALLQNPDDLFFAMACPFHCGSPFLGWEKLTFYLVHFLGATSVRLGQSNHSTWPWPQNRGGGFQVTQ